MPCIRGLLLQCKSTSVPQCAINLSPMADDKDWETDSKQMKECLLDLEKQNKAPDTSLEPMTNGSAAVINNYALLGPVKQGPTVHSGFCPTRFLGHRTEQAYAEIFI